MGAPQPLYVRVSDCPVVYGMDRSTVYRWAERGLVKIHKRGRMSWVNASEMSQAIEGGLGDQLGDQKPQA